MHSFLRNKRFMKNKPHKGHNRKDIMVKGIGKKKKKIQETKKNIVKEDTT